MYEYNMYICLQPCGCVCMCACLCARIVCVYIDYVRIRVVVLFSMYVLYVCIQYVPYVGMNVLCVQYVTMFNLLNTPHCKDNPWCFWTAKFEVGSMYLWTAKFEVWFYILAGQWTWYWE